MTIDTAKKFLDWLDSDESVAREADDAMVGAIHRVAKRFGHEFSEEDLRAAMDAPPTYAALEDADDPASLSDDEMDEVVAAGRSHAGAGIDGEHIQPMANPGGHLTNTVLSVGSRLSSFSKSGFRRG